VARRGGVRQGLRNMSVSSAALMNQTGGFIESTPMSCAAGIAQRQPYHVAKAADLALTIACYRYYAGWADKNQGKTIPVTAITSLHEARAVGVVGQIIP